MNWLRFTPGGLEQYRTVRGEITELNPDHNKNEDQNSFFRRVGELCRVVRSIDGKVYFRDAG